MYMYVYIYMYTYLYIYIYTYVYIHQSAPTCLACALRSLLSASLAVSLTLSHTHLTHTMTTAFPGGNMHTRRLPIQTHQSVWRDVG